MAAPIGALVSIYYDSPRDVAQGDAIVTPTGRTYVVMSVRRQVRGKHTGRWHLKCLIAEAPPEGARTYPIYWYKRGRRPGRGITAACRTRI